MSDIIDYLGVTKFFRTSDHVWRTWHVWGYYDEKGVLSAIRYGISQDLLCAHHNVTKSACTSDLQKHLWKHAQEKLDEGLIQDDESGDDFEVTEPFGGNVVPFIGGSYGF